MQPRDLVCDILLFITEWVGLKYLFSVSNCQDNSRSLEILVNCYSFRNVHALIRVKRYVDILDSTATIRLSINTPSKVNPSSPVIEELSTDIH